jgi:biopolymer transport protein TolQ
VSFDLANLIFQAGLIVKLVLALLGLLSVISWGIIAYKWRELSTAARDGDAFLELYHREPFDAVFQAARDLERSPVAVIFLASCNEMRRLAKVAGLTHLSQLDAQQVRSVTKRLSWTAAREAQRLERGLPFLATTGSSAPFIGLFGTVIGIIQAFQGIAVTGSASLAVVAPGIAEALIATAVGLLAAIPATIFYNLFAGRVDAIGASIELFSGEFEEDLQHMTQRAGRTSAAASDG